MLPCPQVFLRGPPGCGKSTFARRLVAEALGLPLSELASARALRLQHICSTDDFFTRLDRGAEAAEYRGAEDVALTDVA